MAGRQCWCGYDEREDKLLADHLHEVFTPEDMRGSDGRVHEEVGRLDCGCGFAARTPGQLDAHFLAVFMPGDGMDVNGTRHGLASP
jgi:hypothetical protein